MSKRAFLFSGWFTGLLFPIALVGCGSDNGTNGLGSGTGGSSSTTAPKSGGAPASGGAAMNAQGGAKATGGAVTAASGGSQQSAGGTSTSSGGSATGGTTGNQGGSAVVGGNSAGGTRSGGSSSGGNAATGGVQPAGGSSSGGAAMGGKAATGGAATSSGGALTGGNATGGTSSGGVSTGGSSTGGISTGGTSTGGTSTGGAPTGGQATTGGSSSTGGSVTATGGTTATGGSTSTTVGTGAPETKPLGYGQATTGGGSVAATAVSSLAAVQAAIDAYSGTGGLVLSYTGKFDFGSISDPCTQWTATAETLEIKNKSNITLMGADGSAAHFGIHIAANSTNIIIRNMTIGLTAGGDYSDMISIEGMSGGIPNNIWIDHNTLFSSMVECDGAGDVEFDGMIDVKKGADNVTVSYNYMHDHHKVSLNGFSDSDTAVRHITFHHNLFENVSSRTPLQRGGYSHMLNNYFLKVLVSGINVRMDGYSLVESNYFESVVNPVTARDSTAIGYWDLRNNNLASKADVSSGNAYGITWTSGDSGTVNATEWVTTKTYPVSLGYSYAADPFKCVHDGLRATVGAGKGLVTLKCN